MTTNLGCRMEGGTLPLPRRRSLLYKASHVAYHARLYRLGHFLWEWDDRHRTWGHRFRSRRYRIMRHLHLGAWSAKSRQLNAEAVARLRSTGYYDFP